MATNPLIGASWGGQPPPSVLSPSSPISLPPLNQVNTNPGGYGNPQGANEINRNMGLTNIQAGQYKNLLAPQFAALFSKYGTGAGDFFQKLMDLGSPYYQQKQTEGFNQGVQQNNNATASARQQIEAKGYGAAPSGAEAATIGGMEMQGSQNLAEQYLQNLFQNEAMQMEGAGGLASLAQLFNPASVLGGTSIGSNVQAPPSFFQDFQSIMQGLSGAGGQNSSGAGIQL